jgi:hypothetical protein
MCSSDRKYATLLESMKWQIGVATLLPTYSRALANACSSVSAVAGAELFCHAQAAVGVRNAQRNGLLYSCEARV